MRKFTCLAVLAAAGVCVGHTETVRNPMEFMSGFRERVNAARDKKKSIEKVAQVKHEKAATVRTFGWDRGKWMPEDTYSYTYDQQGNVMEELALDAEGDYSKTMNEYDANGKVTFKETTVSKNGLDFTNSRRIELTYDPIMTDVITQRDEQVWLQEAWRPGNCYKRVINRDDAGNVTNVVIAVLFNGIYDPTQRLTITYGDDGKAVRISEQVLNISYETMEYFWEQSIDITDITWDRTDGQIYDYEDLFRGNNRIKTAHYSDVDEISMDISVEYADDSAAYTVSMDGLLDEELMTATTTYTPLENDGYILEGTAYNMDEVLWSSREEYRYDEWGLMTYHEECETEEGFTYGESSTGEVEYDEEGRPAVYTVSQTVIDEETGQEITEYLIRAEYSDYEDYTAGVGSQASPADSERCFDLNGVRIAKPGKGRIVVKDGKTMIVR